MGMTLRANFRRSIFGKLSRLLRESTAGSLAALHVATERCTSLSSIYLSLEARASYLTDPELWSKRLRVSPTVGVGLQAVKLFVIEGCDTFGAD